jgi:hypothetical protein
MQMKRQSPTNSTQAAQPSGATQRRTTRELLLLLGAERLSWLEQEQAWQRRPRDWKQLTQRQRQHEPTQRPPRPHAARAPQQSSQSPLCLFGAAKTARTGLRGAIQLEEGGCCAHWPLQAERTQALVALFLLRWWRWWLKAAVEAMPLTLPERPRRFDAADSAAR